MKKTTGGQIEAVLRKFSKQLKKQDRISVNEAATLARLTSATYRLSRSSGSKSNGVDEMSEAERKEYLFEHGDPSFYESLSKGK